MSAVCNTKDDELLEPEEVAGLVKVKLATVRRWPYEREKNGADVPQCLKLGPGAKAPVRYWRSVIDAWLERCRNK